MSSVRWSPQEKRVLDTYARALARGEYRSRVEAARDYQQNLDRLRRKYPRAGWLENRRTLYGIYRAMLNRSKTLRLPAVKAFWTREECALLDRFARRVAESQSYDGYQAARDYLRSVGELRRKHPRLAWLQMHRTLDATAERIRLRSHEMGRPFLNIALSPEEDRVLARYAHKVLAGTYPGVKQAAKRARVEIMRLHRENPTAHWAHARRSHNAVYLRIARLAATLGRSRPNSPWTHDEDAVIERFARAVVSGRFEHAKQAAQKCWVELSRRRRQPGKRRGALPWAPAPRTMGSVRMRLRIRLAALDWSKCQPAWSRAETVIARRWMRKRADARRRKRSLSWRVAAQAMKRELARMGYRRTEEACLVRAKKLAYASMT